MSDMIDDTESVDEEKAEQAVKWFTSALQEAEVGDFAAAAVSIRDALNLMAEAVGELHPDVSNILNLQGQISAARGDQNAAILCFQQAVHSVQAFTGDPDVDRIHIQSLMNLGHTQRELGQYQAAGETLRQAVNLARRCLGDHDVDTANAENLYGMWCKFTGEFESGREHYQRALTTLQQLRPEGHPDLIALYHNLGGIEHAAGMFAAAERFARKAVRLRLNCVGDRHPDYASEIGALAPILADLGKLDEAESLYQQALTIFEATYGPEHYEVAVVLHNQASLAASRGDLETADRLYRRTIDVKERVLGESHPDTALSLYNQSSLLTERGLYCEAQKLIRRAVAVFEQNLTADHPTLHAAQELRRQLELLDEQA